MPDLDIYSDIILTHQEAKIGTTLLFKSHSEELHNINIKPNTEDEDEIKLEGKGKEDAASGEKGDLYIIVNLISKRGRNNIYEYPKEGVNQQLKNLSWVWDRGYYEQTKDGIWYNLFLNEKIKKEQPNIELNGDDNGRNYMVRFAGFDELDLSMYKEYSQINFFVPNDDDEYNLNGMTDIFA